MKKISKYKKLDSLYTCECGKDFKSSQSLNAHFSHCLKHKHACGQPEILKNRSRSGNKCNFSKAYLGEDGVRKLHAKSEQTIENNIKHGKHYRFNFNGRIKQGWYKGFYCDSSYELVFVIYCLEHNIPIKKCKQIFKYFYQGKEHRYYPDFEINGVIYEIKGYECDKSKFKHKLFPQIKMLYFKDLKNCFNYVIQKYGKNFTKLYEKTS